LSKDPAPAGGPFEQSRHGGFALVPASPGDVVARREIGVEQDFLAATRSPMLMIGS
jgi:hypothetical protein